MLRPVVGLGADTTMAGSLGIGAFSAGRWSGGDPGHSAIAEFNFPVALRHDLVRFLVMPLRLCSKTALGCWLSQYPAAPIKAVWWGQPK